MSTPVPIAVERVVRHRAGGACEYCHLPEGGLPAGGLALAHVIDHVIARQHRGASVVENLALCCIGCNLSKGPNIARLDPPSGQLTRLFHPRSDVWPEHFAYFGGVLRGLTPIGRTTTYVLGVNRRSHVAARLALINVGVRF